MDFKKDILITGGAGFIGTHVIHLFVEKYPDYRIINFDALTYAGNLENLKDIESSPNYTFIKGDIQNTQELERVFSKFNISAVIHLAAESHVDRSIDEPLAFVRTNVLGTANLLNIARKYWTNLEDKRFFHISTDEVYGSLGDEGLFSEESPYDPRSPYSASKASSDHFVRAAYHTYGLPILISNCSNNYGPYQFPEKLIPLMINNIKQEKELPVYGKGENIRDWLWVKDHAKAIDLILHKGEVGNTYNIGGLNEWKNIDLVKKLCQIMDERLGRGQGQSEKLIRFVRDRAGHDMRYAIDASKLREDLGWQASIDFEKGLEMTVDWYLENTAWLDQVTSGDYQDYYQKVYENRD